MKDFPEISLGAKRNEEGEALVYVDGALCGTVENLKRSVDRYWDEEIQRKLAEAGVQFSMVDGVPKISVPTSAAHMVEIEGAHSGKLDASEVETIIKAACGDIPGLRLTWRDGRPQWSFVADAFVCDDPAPAHSGSAFTVGVDGRMLYDFRKDPRFGPAVVAAVKDAKKRRL